MTVIVLSRTKDTYYIHSDGRCSQDWMGIASDNAVKVFKEKDCIFGICGSAAAKVVVQQILKKATDPFKVLKLLHHKDFRDILQPCQILVASAKHGAYTVFISEYEGLMSSKIYKGVVTWGDESLPQIVGSGFLNVRSLLSVQKTITPKVVEEAIIQAYTTNHTIGGKVSMVSVKIKKGKK